MPFVKRSRLQDSSPVDVSPLFVGRAGELLFFVHNILRSDAPTHNILSISGQGGVGKSTLLARFIAEAHEAPYKDYCLTAIIDERQSTPVGMMEKFAQQLHLTGEFAKALKQYKEMLRRQQVERETFYNTLFESVPDIAGAAVEGIPIAGPLLREGTKVATKHLLKEKQASQHAPDATFWESPLDDLTRAFVTELNRLADAKVTLGSTRKKRQRRIMLFFDTFEQMAAETTPWLLDHFLDAQVSDNVVLVIAGRDPIEHTSPDDPKRWLWYCDNNTIYWISLNSFTEDETSMYLVKRGITNADQIANIWHLSQGLPLYLGLLTSNPHGDIDPTKDVVVNFLRWIPEQESIKRQLALDAALLSRPFNQDDLEVFSYVPESERTSLYRWLTEQPFVRSQSQNGRYLYHDVARDLFSRHLYQRSQKHYDEIRRALATYYQDLLEKIQVERGEEVYRSEEWLELLLATFSQLLLLPDQVSHIWAIEHVLHAYHGHTSKDQDAAIARFLHDLSQEPSSHSISPSAQLAVTHLLHYVEADSRSQKWLAASDALVKKIAHKSSCSSKLLARIYYMRGMVYGRLGEKKLALENYQQGLKLLEPTDYNERGHIYWSMRNYQEALAHHNRALEQNPEDTVAYAGRGWAYTNLDEYQLGIADFKHILELDSNSAVAYNGLGQTHLQMGEAQQAIQFFNCLLKLEPDYLSGLRGLGRAYIRLKEYQQALSISNRYLELSAGNAQVYTDRSQCYISLKKYQQSIEECNHAIEVFPREAEAYFQKGLVYLWLKDIGQAQVNFTLSCELNPRYALIAEWTRLCQEAVNQSVLERLETIGAVGPLDYTPYVYRGIAFLLRCHFREALAELEQAQSSKFNNGRNDYAWEVLFWKGIAYAFLGQDDEAMTAIEKALELELPPILLTPLRWFEQERPDFYEKYVVSLLAKLTVF